MKLYHAAVYTSSFGKLSNAYARLNERGREMYDSMENVLESYHYVHGSKYVQAIRGDNRRVFLDSGAFSAFMLGAKIDIGAYCDYIHKNQDIILCASVLDAIGDADGTWRNQTEMERRGVRPLPCYHYGEPPEVLDYYAANYEYITIGGMVPIANNQLRVWLDRLWSHQLTNPDGTPKLRVHGFGLTAIELTSRYPWYSVDSSSWQAMGSNGSIMMPNGWGALFMSDKSPQRKVAGRHYNTLTPIEQASVARVIEDQGLTVDILRESYLHRWAWNMWSFPIAAERLGLCTHFKIPEQELL